MSGKEPKADMADVWRNAPAAASVMGRMSYLSSLRDRVSGQYRQDRLAGRLGEAEADRLLRAAHREIFETWLGFNLRQQSADLEILFSASGSDRRSLLADWVRSAPYLEYPPPAVDEGERLLYRCDLEALSRLLLNGCCTDAPSGSRRAPAEPQDARPYGGLR
jgi:hypothetical protein